MSEAPNELSFELQDDVRDDRPPARAPGELIHVGEQLTDEIRFHLFDYTPKTCVRLRQLR